MAEIHKKYFVDSIKVSNLESDGTTKYPDYVHAADLDEEITFSTDKGIPEKLLGHYVYITIKY